MGFCPNQEENTPRPKNHSPQKNLWRKDYAQLDKISPNTISKHSKLKKTSENDITPLNFTSCLSKEYILSHLQQKVNVKTN